LEATKKIGLDTWNIICREGKKNSPAGIKAMVKPAIGVPMKKAHGITKNAKKVLGRPPSPKIL
jgi:hypothetical protein